MLDTIALAAAIVMHAKWLRGFDDLGYAYYLRQTYRDLEEVRKEIDAEFVESRRQKGDE